MNLSLERSLPPDDPERWVLHNEVHARPSARVRLPALITYVAVLNAGISRDQEGEHLRRLAGQAALGREQLQGNFLRLRCEGSLSNGSGTRNSVATRLFSPCPPMRYGALNCLT